MSVVSDTKYIEKFDKILDKYDNPYERTIKM